MASRVSPCRASATSPVGNGRKNHREQDEQVQPQEQLIGPGELVGQGGVQQPRAAVPRT
jgi:hypothetical protein